MILALRNILSLLRQRIKISCLKLSLIQKYYYKSRQEVGFTSLNCLHLTHWSLVLLFLQLNKFLCSRDLVLENSSLKISPHLSQTWGEMQAGFPTLGSEECLSVFGCCNIDQIVLPPTFLSGLPSSTFADEKFPPWKFPPLLISLVFHIVTFLGVTQQNLSHLPQENPFS